MLRLAIAFCTALSMLPCATAVRANTASDSDPVVATSGFLEYHPDVRHRKSGLRHLKNDQPELAFSAFKRAARYADKGSQAMVAEMYWNGRGVTQDRASAYVWMDLAAERGYRDLLIFRERYWLNLSETERAQALEIGQQLYADFGDEVAKPRLASLLVRGKRHATGSRTGFIAFLSVVIVTDVGEIKLSGSRYYHDLYWKPETYFGWQDRIWDNVHRGRVQVGTVTTPGSQ